MNPIITVTLNPAVDLTVTLEGLTPGKVHRARAAETNAGGKGVNVAGCVADWGAAVTATGLLGRGNDGAFAEFFRRKGIVDRFVRIDGETRTNIKIADVADGETTDINLPGLVVDADTLASVAAVLDEEVAPGTLVVLAGSLPPGCPEDAWAGLVARLGGRGVRTVLDTSDAPLKAALAEGVTALPYAIKPNRHELEDLLGTELADVSALAAAARGLVARGIGLVAVSRGAEGALFVDRDGAIQAGLPPVNALSTVGAGDAMVAGLTTALAEDRDLEGIARQAVAFATAKLGGIGPNLPPLDEVRRLMGEVRITPLA